MFSLSKALLPEMILICAAAIAFLLGTSPSTAARKLAPVVTLLALAAAMFSQIDSLFHVTGHVDPWQSVQISQFTRYIKLIGSGIAMLLTLLAWPTNADATAGRAIHFGSECGEFFGLLLLSITGLFLAAGANDMMLLFLGIELSSLPTYIMVSISRPLAVAQEAGVKYFFLGAMAAAVLLFGFSYLYGTTGTIYLHTAVDADGTNLPGVDSVIGAARGLLTAWQMLAVVILIAGFAFKMVAFPMHVYAADVYQGAATPVTALISFVPKATGFVALLKVLYAAGASSWTLPPEIGRLLWWIAVLTMSCGNVLGLLQQNVKRVFACSSIAHSGYMLVAVAALVTAGTGTTALTWQETALRGVLFYLAAYGLTNIAAFGVLSLLPAREDRPGSSAETFDEIAGLGRAHVGLGLAMAVSCFSLVGIPLTVGFVGKVLLIQPALQAGLYSLVAVLVINSAVSAGYYLRIVAALFLRPRSSAPGTAEDTGPSRWPLPTTLAILASVAAVLLMGMDVPLMSWGVYRTQAASQLDLPPMVSKPMSGVVSVGP